MNLIDAHHHLWDLDAVRYPWLLEHGKQRFFGDPTPIQKNYLVDDFKYDAATFNVLGSVHIQVGAALEDELAETAWQQRNAETSGLPSAIVAACDLTRRDLHEMLDAHAEHDRLRGIRQIVGRADDEDAVTGTQSLLTDAAWLTGLKVLAARSLSFDLQLTPRMMLTAAKTFAEVPSLPVALCHAGSPMDFSVNGIAAWKDGMRALSEQPQIHCKISGFGMFNHHWTVSDIAPLVEFCIETFGADRCMFGSNFPVDKLYRDYAGVWAAYAEIVAGLSVETRSALFVSNANWFYRLGLTLD
ncbi:MAG: amidohydrolase family protein [Pseudomonadota bacterium]